MKKSILTKILLAMLMLALVFAMVACGGKNPSKPDDKDKDKDKQEQPADTDLAEQIVNVLKGADPLLKAINGIKSDSTVGLDVGLTVDFAAGKDDDDKDVKGTYKVGVKGRLNKTAPELDISYKANSKDWFRLAYVNKKAYLAQPLTAVNTANDVDEVAVDVAALEPAVKSMMGIVMDVIPGVTSTIPAGIPAETTEVISNALGSLSWALDGLNLKVESTSNGNRIQVAGETLDTLLPTVIGMVFKDGSSLAPYKGVAESLIAKIKGVNNEGCLPTITLDIRQKDEVINGLDIGYQYKDEAYFGKLIIDLAVSTTDGNVGKVTAPNYKAQALEAVVNAKVPQKGIQGELKVDVNPNFSADYMGYASLAFTDLNNKKLGTLVGWANDGKAVYFDTLGLYKALGIESGIPENTVYKATLASNKSVADLINEGAAKIAADYEASKDEKPAEEDEQEPAGDEKKEPSKGILVNIYEWLGGDLTKLKTKTDDDGNVSYEDPSEEAMLAQLDVKIGKNCNFKVNEKSYFAVVKNIVALFAENDEDITGIDMVDKSVVNTAADWGDLLDAINTDNFKKNDSGKYGIANWDTTNWTGGIQLYKKDKEAGKVSDLLDVVNVFVKNSTTNKPFTVDNICEDICDYYIAALGYYFGIYDSDEYAAIDALDKAFCEAQDAYNKKLADGTATADDTAAFEKAKKDHKDALKAYYKGEKTQEMLKMLFGVDRTLKQMIEGGVNLYVGCVKDGGLNGYIGLKKAADSGIADTYVEIGATLAFVDNTVEKNAKDAIAAITQAKVDAAQELTTKGENKIAKQDRFDHYIDEAGFIVEKEEDAAQVDTYPTAEALLTELFETLGMYIEKDNFTVAAE